MRRAARRRGSGSSAIAGSTSASSANSRLEAGHRGLDLGRESRRSRASAQAGGDLGSPEPALLGGGLGLVEVAGGQQHGLEADAIELVRVILER